MLFALKMLPLLLIVKFWLLNKYLSFSLNRIFFNYGSFAKKVLDVAIKQSWRSEKENWIFFHQDGKKTDQNFDKKFSNVKKICEKWEKTNRLLLQEIEKLYLNKTTPKQKIWSFGSTLEARAWKKSAGSTSALNTRQCTRYTPKPETFGAL